MVRISKKYFYFSSMNEMIKKDNKIIVFILIILFAIFTLQEILLRIVFPIPEISNFNRINYSPLFFGTEAKKVKYLENASFIWASLPDNTENINELNLYGFRDEDWNVKKEDNIKRVIFIGDSFVEGFLSSRDSIIPTSFGKVAFENYYDLQVMNMGIGGNDFNGYFKLLRDAVTIFKPDYLFLIINSNDLPAKNYKPSLLEDKIKVKFSNEYTPRLISVIDNYLSGKTVAHRWKSKPFYFFPAVPSLRNPWSLSKNRSEWERYVSPKIANAMMKGRFNPFSVDEYDDYKTNLLNDINVSGHFTALRNFCDENEVKVYLAYIPSRSQVSDYYLKYQKEFCKTKNPTSLMGYEYQLHARIISDVCSKLGLDFFDFTPIFKKAEAKGIHLYWNYDEHLNSTGYNLAGKSLFKWWKNHY